MVLRPRCFSGVVLVLSLAGFARVPGASAGAGSAPLFSAGAYVDHVRYLASDELAGRLVGTPGIEAAAEYIAARFAAAGLTPAGDDGTWFQTFEVAQGKRLVDEEAELVVSGLEGTWKVRADWIPLPFTAMQDVEAPLAFAGYGISAPEHGWDDYAGFDATGKALLVFRYEPESDDPEAEFGGREFSRHALFRRKERRAAEAGAVALLIVTPRRAGAEAGLYPFTTYAAQQTFELPLVHISRELGDALVRRAGLGGLDALQAQLDRERQPRSADLNLTLRLRPGVQPNRPTTRNVLGLLPGTGDSGEAIVVGAHYDHLGEVPLQFGRGDNALHIHNGADDNASGTAAVLELARVLAAEGGLRRDVLFVAFSAEEMGLLGSKHFLEQPPVPADGIRAMVNFDMVGRMYQGRFTVFGTGSGQELPDLVRRAADQAGLDYRAPPGVVENSDHAGFYHRQIPILFAFTGVHKQYHRPDDDWELIDGAGAARILEMFRHIVRDLANLEAGPAFVPLVAPPEPEDQLMKPGVEHAQEAARGQADAATSQPGPASRPVRDDATPAMPRVRLGIVPGFGESEPGVVAESVVPGGAAAAAGMRDGDRIVRIGTRDIRDIYGYMDALSAHQPGDTIEVVVIRAGAEVELRVTLREARRPPGAD